VIGLMRRRLALAGIAAIAAMAAGCSSGGPTAVKVSLQEWAVVPAASSAKAGAVTFEVTNTGPDDVHEFVVIRTDLDPGALPVDADGAVTEEGQGMTVVDEIEDIAIGSTQKLDVTLAAGKYVLICNIYDAPNKEAHYQLGMRTAFTVNP
jgi:uncharacterized cupredoxin-like copper-binding protein